MSTGEIAVLAFFVVAFVVFAATLAWQARH